MQGLSSNNIFDLTAKDCYKYTKENFLSQYENEINFLSSKIIDTIDKGEFSITFSAPYSMSMFNKELPVNTVATLLNFLKELNFIITFSNEEQQETITIAWG